MNPRVALLFIAVLSIIFAACQSAEITSAKVYIQQENRPAAIEQLKVAEKNEPTNPEVFLLEGKIYAEMDSFAQMTNAFDRALELDSTLIKDIQSWRAKKRAKVFNKGLRFGKKKEWDKAIKYTKIAVMIDPTFADGWFNLGFLYQKAGEKEKAEQAYLTAYALEPTNTNLAKQAAIYYFNDDQTDTAIAILTKIADEGKPDVETYTLLASMFVSKGQSKKADEMFAKAEALDPENLDLLFDRGVAKFNQEDFAAASSYFQKILDIDPTNRDALYNLSLSQFNDERFDEAIASAEKLVKHNPQDKKGWAQYGLSLLRGGQIEKGKAATLVTDAIEKMESGQYDDAIGDLKTVTSKHKKWCAPWAVMKVIYSEKGDTLGSAEAQAGLDNCGE
ncbi:tetratricopeptide repeat protein [bacterium]|nr:tetratricopeptide repeat protein [bacterium]